MNTIANDTKFAAWARAQQNKWRENHHIPIGTYKQKQKDGTYQEIQLGNYIDYAHAKEKMSNFLSPEISQVVRYAMKNREPKAVLSKKRLLTNMLSSQPLAFNLFAKLSVDTVMATEFFKRQFPGRIKKVTSIIFEHSDGRGDISYTGDHSAFDVFVEYLNPAGARGFLAIEVKYAENLKNPPADHKGKRYKELTKSSGLFKSNSLDKLKKSPLEQIWRDHLLSIAHLKHDNQKYAEGFFVYLFPKENDECLNAVNKYIQEFESFDPVTNTYDEQKTGFYIRHMKEFAIDLKQVCKDQWLEDFLLRYFDLAG